MQRKAMRWIQTLLVLLGVASLPVVAGAATLEVVAREIRGVPVPLHGAGRAPVQILGALTIRGVTRPTTWEGTGEFRGSTVRLQARTAFPFADFELPQRRVMRVLSIEDQIRLEVALTLRPAS